MEAKEKITPFNKARMHCLELENMSAQAVAKVVEEEFGPKFQAAGGKIVFGDNDKKFH